MKRALSYLTTGALIALLVGVTILWVRSYRVADFIGWGFRGRTPGTGVGIVSSRNAVSFSVFHIKLGRMESGFYWNSAAPALPLADAPGPLTFGVEDYSDPDEDVLGLMVPHWLLAVAFAAPLTMRAVAAARRSRRVRRGHCVRCGYDLRASPSTCPECGSTPAK